MLPRLSRDHLEGRSRPRPRILQFGGGNFLRAFIDWKIDRMNETAGLDWGIVILRSVGHVDQSPLNAQDGLYTVLSRGIGPNGVETEDARIVASVLSEIDCRADWRRVLDLASDPDISTIISNTTEAGIAYDPFARVGETPPSTFPAKVAALLAHRWSALQGRPGTGWDFLPCELTEANGDALRDAVLRHIRDWNLPVALLNWIETDCMFYNTLVDRIVSGYPDGEAEAIESRLGYVDSALVTAEPFHFFAIERRPGQFCPQLPIANWDDGTTVVCDLAPIRLRKVALLNGAHTALCPLAILAGIETVAETVGTPWALRFLNTFWEEEVKPFTPVADVDAYTEEVLRRFANPFLRHRWRDIMLNGLSKVRVRNIERMSAYIHCHGRAPRMQALSLAAWLAVYRGKAPLPPRDGDGTLHILRAIEPLDDGTEAGRAAYVRSFVGNTDLWGCPLDSRIAEAVTEAYVAICEGKDIVELSGLQLESAA